jgi:phage shock protein A
MADFMESVTSLISTDLHTPVDEALKSNQLVVIDQFIRQAEDHLENLAAAVATVSEEIATTTDKLDTEQARAVELDKAVDGLLVEGNEEAAAATQSRLNNTHRLIETYQEQIDRLESEHRVLHNARAALKSRLKIMVAQRDELQALLALVNRKAPAILPVNKLDDLLNCDDAEISRRAQNISDRFDQAGTRSKPRAGNLDKQIDDLLGRESINQQLSERKQKLSIDP